VPLPGAGRVETGSDEKKSGNETEIAIDIEYQEGSGRDRGINERGEGFSDAEVANIQSRIFLSQLGINERDEGRRGADIGDLGVRDGRELSIREN